MQNLNYKTFYRWTRDEYCDIDGAVAQEELHGHDVTAEDDAGKESLVEVPIYRPECVGESMAIDEKSIGNNVYTTFTNAETGRIALMCGSLKSSVISTVLTGFGEGVLRNVKSVTRDFSTSFEAVLGKTFPSAMQTVDKFHAVKELMTDLQAFRISLKSKELKRYTQERKKHAKLYAEDQKKPKSEQSLKKVYHPALLPNGETTAELLHRSRYLLYKRPIDWSPQQAERAKLLFSIFPELCKAYMQATEFRDWYVGNTSDSRDGKEHLLKLWLKDVLETPYSPLKAFANTVKANWDYLLNYFVGHHTNAIAESTNAQIQIAAIKNRGARDSDFFFYRISHFLNPVTSK